MKGQSISTTTRRWAKTVAGSVCGNFSLVTLNGTFPLAFIESGCVGDPESPATDVLFFLPLRIPQSLRPVPLLI